MLPDDMEALMRVGVGYSDNPDTAAGGAQAAREALQQAGAGGEPCDFVLMFATARHEGQALRNAVASVLGEAVPVVGGGAVGAICADRFGYAGDQIVLAAFWLEGRHCDLFYEAGLVEYGEETVGERLGKRFAEAGVTPPSSVMLFYDAINRTQGDTRLIMATPLLAGLEKTLGFLPNLVGAGLQGDYASTPTKEWAGHEVVQHYALGLVFGGDIRIDPVIMHGCRPATGYYTVTKADRQTILEINNEPALDFLDKLLGSSVAVDDYPFFLILGMNRGDKWADFNEQDYANRLCLALDKERGGVVMFEPDMVAGTEFQVMHRTLQLDYMAPRIHAAFDNLEGRKPVLALYIDCAGRAAAYAGVDLEDAVVVQEAVAGRAPLLGIYSGVEIAPVGGRSHGLDWTGVFCLFSVPS